MKVYSILALILAFSQISCLKSPNRPKKNTTVETVHKEESLTTYHHALVGDSLVYRVNLDEAPIHIESHLEREDQFIKIDFENAASKSIKGTITTEKQQNVRFSHVMLNEKSIDGPFGKDLNYTFDEAGHYSLVVGKSMMADGTQIGKLAIDFSVQ